jgi:hypothetical protein
MQSRYKRNQGWKGESQRHSLARRGIKTKINYAYTVGDLPNIVTQGLGTAGATAVGWIPPLVAIGATAHILKKGKKLKKQLGWARQSDDDNLRVLVHTSPVFYNLVGRYMANGMSEKKAVELAENDVIAEIKKRTKYMEGIRKKINYATLPPQDIRSPPPLDTDKDGVPDEYDWDDDNDSVPDWQDTEGMFGVDQYKGEGVFDPFYNNPKDSDFDGVPDVSDLYPLNPHKARDWAKKNKIVVLPYNSDKFKVLSDKLVYYNGKLYLTKEDLKLYPKKVHIIIDD